MTETKNLPAIEAGRKVQAIVPATPQEVDEYARLLCQNHMAPKSYDNDPGKVAIGVMASLELGIPPLQGLQGIYVINGVPTVWGDLALALANQSGLMKSFAEWNEGDWKDDTYKALCRIVRHDRPDEETLGEFSKRMAFTAQLLGKKGPWQTYPWRMMKMRARGFALRDAVPEALKGMKLTEEMIDTTDADIVMNKDGTFEVAPQKRHHVVDPFADAEDAEVIEDTDPLDGLLKSGTMIDDLMVRGAEKGPHTIDAHGKPFLMPYFDALADCATTDDCLALLSQNADNINAIKSAKDRYNVIDRTRRRIRALAEAKDGVETAKAHLADSAEAEAKRKGAKPKGGE